MSNGSRTVLVTGCSSGLGRAIALRLADEGFRVVAGVRSSEQADELRQAAPPELETVLLDVTLPEQIHQAVQRLEQISPHGLHGLVNNAGVGMGAATELSPLDEVRHLFEVNTFGPLALIQQCLPLLRKCSGRIVNVTSTNGVVALPMVGPYSASKFALEAFSNSLRVELRPWGISVIVVRPGQIRTKIFDKAQQSLERHQAAIPPALEPGYLKMYQRAARFNERGSASKTTPEAVAKKVSRALTARTPRLRYHVGFDSRAMQWVNRLVPHRLLDRIYARVMGTFHRVDP